MRNLRNIYWIGTRESEIYNTGDLFEGSITVFGSNEHSNYSFDKEYMWRFNYNEDNIMFTEFVNNTAKRILTLNPSAKFMLYFPNEASEYSDEIQDNSVCQNPIELLDLLENKIYSKLWIKSTAKIIPFITMTGAELKHKNLSSYFPGYNNFVIQSTFSSGGFNTKIYQKNDKSISDNILYMVTPYIEHNIPINVHAIIYGNDILLLPPSIQIISITNGMLLYKGADFIAYEKIPQRIKESINSQAIQIAEKLQKCGYRGVCGIDLLYSFELDTLFFSEINSRFQSSTFLINKVLDAYNVSVQKLHYDAFHTEKCEYEFLHSISIPYSFYSYQYSKDKSCYIKYLYDRFKDCEQLIDIYDDQLSWDMKLDEYTHMFKAVFKKNIIYWEPDKKIRIMENVVINPFDFKTLYNKVPLEMYFICLKASLLNQGISISPEALKYIERQNQINCKEFEAIDIKLDNGLYFNVPYNFQLSEISPFRIEMDSPSTYRLYYFGNPMNNVIIRTCDPLASNRTKNGILYEDIAYLGIDRLRIYHRQSCYFKEQNIGCGFCDIDEPEKSFQMDDILEVIDAYKTNTSINHFLIGGGSEAPDSDFCNIIRIAKYIKNLYHKPIYLMSIPPKSNKILEELYEAGITEVAFNIELYNRELSKKYMPGKSCITIDKYLSVLENAVKIWGNAGAVRSIFILGLEPKESLLEGIEQICKLGVSPILSILKPIPNTRLEHMISFRNKEIIALYKDILSICEKYHVTLGPQCHYCEDNTLKISLN